MSNTVLLVDDEVNILNSFRRTLRNQIDIELANSGQEALELVAKNKYAVIVTDMQMPEMNGLELLEAIKIISPDTVRMMFTGNADQKTAVDAVNKGDVFRFISKPCTPPELLTFIQSALRQYDLIVSERVLLNQTLAGTISVLNEVLSLASPQLNEHNARIQFHMFQLRKALKLKKHWSFQPMVQLSQLGYITFPQQTLQNISRGNTLSEEDQQLYEQHPRLSYDLLRKIPRMESIAKAILYQDKAFNGEGPPYDEMQGKALPLGSRMLKVVCDYVRLEKEGATPDQATETLEQRSEQYDVEILEAFKTTLSLAPPKMFVDLTKLSTNMILKQEIWTDREQLVAGKGQRVTEPLLRIIQHCLQNNAISGQVEISLAEEEDT
ncbi:response regulator [Vibrio sp. ZSDE26]|uniref:Response regulator n=1 Tax=Vibrio amylolyticus TaxID=2847292 RepID=A0A9X1XJS4_9VIBR|nr:HD domain-containing phosphohydrolase [Vibrio amylolyticus]MCK6264046.1 response regulator [Vibrio amylolyticus]